MSDFALNVVIILVGMVMVAVVGSAASLVVSIVGLYT